MSFGASREEGWRRLPDNFPHVHLRVEQGSYQDVLIGGLDYELDFEIVPLNPDRHDILFYLIIEETIVFVASNPIMSKVEEKGLEVLNDELFMSNGTTCLYQTTAIERFRKAGIVVKDALELSSLEMIKQSVSCLPPLKTFNANFCDFLVRTANSPHLYGEGSSRSTSTCTWIAYFDTRNL